jgi:hypothetical protein
MPFYTYADMNTDPPTVEEFLLPVDHDTPTGKDGKPMIRVYKSTYFVIPTTLNHEKSASYQQGAIKEKGY